MIEAAATLLIFLVLAGFLSAFIMSHLKLESSGDPFVDLGMGAAVAALASVPAALLTINIHHFIF